MCALLHFEASGPCAWASFDATLCTLTRNSPTSECATPVRAQVRALEAHVQKLVGAKPTPTYWRRATAGNRPVCIQNTTRIRCLTRPHARAQTSWFERVAD